MLSSLSRSIRSYTTSITKTISLVKYPNKTINFNSHVYDYTSSTELLNVSNNILDLNHTKITIAGDDKEIVDYLTKYIERVSFDVKED